MFPCRNSICVQMCSRHFISPSSCVWRVRGCWGGRAVSSGLVDLPREVVIAGAARTPIGSFCGGLASLSAVRLSAAAIGAAMRRAGLEPHEIDTVMLGQVLVAGCGQNAARQASLLAEIPASVDCTSINKACASGLKAVSLAAQAIALGQSDVAVAGGMENMSQAPYIIRHARQGGYHYGHGALEDIALLDGLWDATQDCHMGSCVENTIQELSISREEQDRYTISSYRRAADAWQRGAMDGEVVPVRVKGSGTKSNMEKRSMIVSVDEEYARLKLDTVASLPPIFEEGGTITAASTSSLNDGAAALVLMSASRARDLGVSPLARIVSFADHAVEPLHFAKAPSAAVRTAMRAARMSSINFYEIHEAFAAVALLARVH